MLKPTRSLLSSLRNVYFYFKLFLEKLQNVFECYEYYMKVYHPRQILTEDEFDDIFCSLLNDCEAYFNLLKDKETGLCSFLEAFVSLTVFAKGDFDHKIRASFMAFDCDESGYIDRKELLTLLLHGVYGLCKLVGLPLPHREDITQFAIHAFKTIDEDNSDMIEYNEYSVWVRESEELQSFLLRYTGQQTFERARKRY